MENQLILKNLTLPYPLEAVKGREFHIPKGEITVIEGISGRGKTSLFHVITGLLTPTSGVVEHLPKNCSALFQEPRLVEHCSGFANVKITTPNISKECLEEHFSHLLPKEAWHRHVRHYSRGMKQKTAIIRAMVNPADFLIMDEVFTGLDNESKSQVAQYILKYRNLRSLVILVHQKEDVAIFHPSQVISL